MSYLHLLPYIHYLPNGSSITLIASIFLSVILFLKYFGNDFATHNFML